MRSAAIAGWSIIAIFFGGFGAWAVTAPLHGGCFDPTTPTWRPMRLRVNNSVAQHLEQKAANAE